MIYYTSVTVFTCSVARQWGNASHFVGMKCSSCHTFAPIDSIVWRPNSLQSVPLAFRLVEAQLPPIREEAQLPPLYPGMLTMCEAQLPPIGEKAQLPSLNPLSALPGP